MKLATYNILKGGSHRIHWTKMIDDLGVDLLLLQESYPHDEHLPPLRYPDSRNRSVWEMVEQNGWGSAVFSSSGTLKQISVLGSLAGLLAQRFVVRPGNRLLPTALWHSVYMRNHERPLGQEIKKCR